MPILNLLIDWKKKIQSIKYHYFDPEDIKHQYDCFNDSIKINVGIFTQKVMIFVKR